MGKGELRFGMKRDGERDRSGLVRERDGKGTGQVWHRKGMGKVELRFGLLFEGKNDALSMGALTALSVSM